jgi:hypothetical protein
MDIQDECDLDKSNRKHEHFNETQLDWIQLQISHELHVYYSMDEIHFLGGYASQYWGGG